LAISAWNAFISSVNSAVAGGDFRTASNADSSLSYGVAGGAPGAPPGGVAPPGAPPPPRAPPRRAPRPGGLVPGGRFLLAARGAGTGGFDRRGLFRRRGGSGGPGTGPGGVGGFAGLGGHGRVDLFVGRAAERAGLHERPRRFRRRHPVRGTAPTVRNGLTVDQ